MVRPCRPSDRVFAVAGIARPERFFADLAAAGWNVVGTMRVSRSPSVHHRDVERDSQRPHEPRDAIVLTTEKDAVRLAAARPRDAAGRRRAADVGIEPAAGVRRMAARRGCRPARRVRHRLEYLIVTALTAVLRVVPDRAGSRVRHRRSGSLFYTFDRAHRRIAERNLAAAFPVAAGGRAPRHRPRRLRALRPAAVRAAEVQHAVARGDARARRVRGRGARAARLRAGQGRAVLHRPLRLLGAARDRARAAARADRRAGARARQPAAERRCSSTSGSAPATR